MKKREKKSAILTKRILFNFLSLKDFEIEWQKRVKKKHKKTRDSYWI